MSLIDDYLKIKGEMGDNLIRWRKSHSYTQKRAGEILSVHPTYVSQIERGVRPPSDKFIRKFLEVR